MITAPVLVLAGALVLGHAEDVQRANQLYAAGKFAEAAEIYRRVQADLPENAIPAVNLGAAALKAGKPDEAATAFKKAKDEAKDNGVRGRAAYGLGSCLAKTGDLEGALASFKQAAELLPDDEDAKWNFECVKRRLDEQKQEQQKQDDPNPDSKDQDKKDGDGQDTKQDGEKKESSEQEKDQQQQQDEQQKQEEQKANEPDDPKKDEQKKEDEKKASEQKSPDEKDQKQQAKPEEGTEPKDEKQVQEMTKDQVQQLLDALKQDEKAIRKLVKKPIAGPRGEPKKDW